MMIARKRTFWYKIAAIPVVALLIMFVLLGWGDGDGADEVSTPAAVPTTTKAQQAPTPTSTSDPSNDGPVRIGLLADWTGPTGITGPMVDEVADLVEEQVEETAGILGGRPINIVKADSQGTVSGAVAGFRKLTLDGVSVVVGGASNAAGTLVNVETAEHEKVPYIDWGLAPDDLAGYPYTIRAITIKTRPLAQQAVEFVVKQLEPTTVAFLLDNVEMFELSSELEWRLEAEGVKIVQIEHIEVGTMDFTPDLTKIKYRNPDLIICGFANPSAYMAIYKQIMDLGGWDDIQFLSVAPISLLGSTMPGAQGTYHLLSWYAELPVPGNLEFVQAMKAKYGRDPNIAQFYAYTCLWTAIHAIELAGSDDPQDTAQAMRSGDLEWDSPAGPYRISADGEHHLKGRIVVVKEGKPGPVDPSP